ncbi:MAG: hypothetical protein ABDH49_02490 [Candidatus Hydrothermales bacterium]
MEGLLREARKAYKKGLLKEAKLLFEKVIEITKGEYMEIYPDYIGLLLDLKEYEKAEKILKSIEKEIEKDGSVSLLNSFKRLKARLLREKGNFEEAKRLLKEILNHKGLDDEERGKVNFALAKIYFIEGDYDKAERCFTESEINFRGTSLIEEEGWATLWRAKIARIKGEWLRSNDILKILLREYKNISKLLYSNILLEKALLLFEEGKKEEALEIEKILEETLENLRAPRLKVEVRLRLSNPLSIDANEFRKVERRSFRILTYLPKEEKTLRGLALSWLAYVKGFYGEKKDSLNLYKLAERELLNSSYEEKGLHLFLKLLTLIEFKNKEKAEETLEILNDKKYPYFFRSLAILTMNFEKV